MNFFKGMIALGEVLGEVVLIWVLDYVLGSSEEQRLREKYPDLFVRDWRE